MKGGAALESVPAIVPDFIAGPRLHHLIRRRWDAVPAKEGEGDEEDKLEGQRWALGPSDHGETLGKKLWRYPLRVRDSQGVLRLTHVQSSWHVLLGVLLQDSRAKEKST